MIKTRNWFALLPLLALCACSTVQFYTQAISGQAEIWRKSRPNDVALADPSVAEKVKQRLRLIEELRAFAASDLHLPTKSFGKCCDLKRPFVVWVVYAAPEFSRRVRFSVLTRRTDATKGCDICQSAKRDPAASLSQRKVLAHRS